MESLAVILRRVKDPTKNLGGGTTVPNEHPLPDPSSLALLRMTRGTPIHPHSDIALCVFVSRPQGPKA
jgi:hypothetical protein